jgi:hypothetical protein
LQALDVRTPQYASRRATLERLLADAVGKAQGEASAAIARALPAIRARIEADRVKALGAIGKGLAKLLPAVVECDAAIEELTGWRGNPQAVAPVGGTADQVRELEVVRRARGMGLAV